MQYRFKAIEDKYVQVIVGSHQLEVNGLEVCAGAAQAAWKGLGSSGFVAIGGNSAAGEALHAKAMPVP